MKVRRVYVCQACGHCEHKWLGRCPACQAWSSFVEEAVAPEQTAPLPAPTRAGAALADARTQAVALSQITHDAEPRFTIGIPEFDRVLGGGLVKGALVLVGGDPGIGKSTILLQAFARLAASGVTTLYATAEESLSQVKMRADRLAICADNLFLMAETQLERIDAARRAIAPQVMVIDSIQTIGLQHIESAVGSVGQIRAVTQRLMDIAKGEGTAIFVVGHVTKEGAIAGPKVMEHMVDTVLYFEGERTGPYRILRAHKNRFGSSHEIGVFEMDGRGLQPVSNPSELFLGQRAKAPGAVVVSSLEGSRPLLLEVQALATPSPYGTPRRTTLGFDPQRVAMLCAVLGARAGIDLAGHDVYVNMAGGVRVSEPAADLGVLLALASTAQRRTLPDDMVVMGEVGLAGEVRGTSQLRARVQEAASLGFKRCLVPSVEVERWKGEPPALPLEAVATIKQALERVGLL